MRVGSPGSGKHNNVAGVKTKPQEAKGELQQTKEDLGHTIPAVEKSKVERQVFAKPDTRERKAKNTSEGEREVRATADTCRGRKS